MTTLSYLSIYCLQSHFLRYVEKNFRKIIVGHGLKKRFRKITLPNHTFELMRPKNAHNWLAPEPEPSP